jgi:hypothetical protein
MPAYSQVLSADGVLDSQIIQAENGDVIKQSCGCNQAATTNAPIFEPKAQALVDALAVRGGEPIDKLSHADARNALAVLAIGTTYGSDTYQHRSREI